MSLKQFVLSVQLLGSSTAKHMNYPFAVNSITHVPKVKHVFKSFGK